MTNTDSRPDLIEIDLGTPGLAAFFGWLIPGCGHFYQRRYAKGFLFMICVLTTYFVGLGLGEGRVVYAQWQPNDHRWQYFFQVGVGIPALPAVVQQMRSRDVNTKPLFNGWMAPPRVAGPDSTDQLAEFHLKLNTRFELGTLYTMIAGLLNMLAIYDAYAGPALATQVSDDGEDRRRDGPKKGRGKKST